MNFITPLLALKDALVYRFRGGGFFSTGHDWIVRLVWGSSLIITYLALNYAEPDYFYAASILGTAYLAMLVPHAFCQNMGRWPTAQKEWPAFFLPELTDLQWTALPGPARTLYDFLAMAGVAAFRGLFVFTPFLLSAYLQHGQIELAGVLRACGTIIVFQPLAYLVGWYVPFSVGGSLTKNTTEWCEFLNGAAWAVAVAQL